MPAAFIQADRRIDQCQNSSNRMMIGIGMPSSHNRIPLPMTQPLFGFGGDTTGRALIRSRVK
jgi:hypothetical protein